MRISDWSSDVCSSDLLPRTGEAEVLEPHGLEPGERHVHLHAVDLSARIGDPGLCEHVGRAVGAASRQHGVAVRRHRRLRAHRRPPHPRRWLLSPVRSEEHTSELQSLMRISYAVFCLKKKTNNIKNHSEETDTQN